MPNIDQFTKEGKYLMLAFDHRASFKKLLNPENPDSVPDNELVELKKRIIDAVADQFSGILIDLEIGQKAYQGHSQPFLLPVEKSGIEEHEGERITRIEYGINDLQGWGASGAKLLMYFNPFLHNALDQLDTAKMVVEECKNKNFPLFLEIVTYEKDHEPTLEEREKLVIESVKMFVAHNVVPDVFKLEYPGSALACRTITAILQETGTPWIILTRGDSFDHFKDQLKEAVSRGAVGFLAGRALWQDVAKLQGDEREHFLNEVLPQRFREICEITK